MRTVGVVWLLMWMPSVAFADTVVEENIVNLRSRIPAVRQQAARTLGRDRDVAAVPALIRALEDPEKSVRREAAKSLGFLKDRRAVDALVVALRDADMNVRLFAAYALGEMKDARANGPLLEKLQDPQWCVRDQAAWALAEINDPAIVAPLVSLLQENGADTTLLVRLLRHYGDTETGRQVAILLDDTDPETRLRALQVLREISAPALLDKFIKALEDNNPAVRRSAVLTIARQWDDRAREPLTSLVERESDEKVRAAATELLFEQSPERNLAAYWSFDAGDTETATDVTGHGNDGRIQGCTPVPGRIGRGLQFGLGKFIAFGQPAGLPIANQPLTILAWVESHAENGVVIARGGAFCGYSLYLKDGVAKFGIQRIQDGPGYIAEGEPKVVGRWVHLAGVIKQESLELYIDGALAATVKTAGYIPGNCGQGMEIGFDVSNSPAEITDHFEGIIDEVKIYNVALSAKEIAEEFHAAENPGRTTKEINP